MLPKATDEWTVDEAAHLMRRAGFGGPPEKVAKLHAMGRAGAVGSLLNPAEEVDAFPLPDWAGSEEARALGREKMSALREARIAAKRNPDEEAGKRLEMLQKRFQREARKQRLEAQRWWFDRLMRSEAPLREKMVLFWHDHFATSIQKVKQPALMLRQNGLFRAHAFGNFRELTHAMLRDPAMMLYLDTQTSVKGKPNENFAREVMELFVLGEGRYGEEDVKEAARAFTGYRFNRLSGEVVHVRRRWDGGPKTVLGRTGAFDGDQVIDLLFEQEAAAEHLVSKLWRYFVSDEAPDAVVRRLAATLRENRFEVAPVLGDIFLSRAFYDSTVVGNQIKSPIQFLVQMAGELGIDELPAGQAELAQVQLGQVLLAPPNVAGWNWGKGWINTNTLLGRYNIAGLVTKGSVSTVEDASEGGEMMMEMEARTAGPVGKRAAAKLRSWSGPDYEALAPRSLREDPEALVDALIGRFFGTAIGGRQREAFLDYAIAKKGVVFTNREVAELCHLMMSTPHYQLA